MPSKFYGACAAGKPVIFIGDSKGEIPGILNNTETGIAVEQKNDEKLSEVILKLKNDNKLEKNMGANARRIYDERFSMDMAFSEWEKAINSMIGD